MESKRTLRNQQISNYILAAFFAVIILILIFTPLGFIEIGTVAITIIHIPVLVGAILLGKYYGMFLGAVFGVGAMVKSFILLPANAPFTNPLLSVVPRVIFALIAAIIFDLIKSKTNKYVAVPVTMGVATLFHSVIVLFLLYLVVKLEFFFFPNEFIYLELFKSEKMFPFIYGIFISNSIFEIALAVLIGSAVTYPLLIVKEQMN